MGLGGMFNLSRGYPTLTADICLVLTEIAFETVCDLSLQCGCFGLLMIQWHILKGASRHVHQGGHLRDDRVGMFIL